MAKQNMIATKINTSLMNLKEFGFGLRMSLTKVPFEVANPVLITSPCTYLLSMFLTYITSVPPYKVYLVSCKGSCKSSVFGIAFLITGMLSPVNMLSLIMH